MNDIEIARLKKSNRIGRFKIADSAMSDHVDETKKILSLVHITETKYDKDKGMTTYTGYSASFLPIIRGQPPIEYSALLDSRTRKFLQFKAKGSF